MAPKINIENRGILISAIVLIISVLLLIDRLLAQDPVRLILENGKAVPVEGASYFSLNEVLLFILAAWLGGMSFLYIILSSKEKETTGSEQIETAIPENKSAAMMAADILNGDEKILFQKIVENDGLLQRELILNTDFSEPKVSRLLDKLERRGLIIRKRDGMGNRVLLKKS
jgi:uncharacterized membrane protein